MNSKEIIIKKILEHEIYKQNREKKLSFWISIKANFVALRFLPLIIKEVIKNGRR